MNFTAFIDALSTANIDTLADFDRKVALAAGIQPTTVRAWAKLQDLYFGPTKHGKFQRRALSRARAGGFSLDQLAMLERRIAHLAPGEQWRHRVRLLANACTYAEFEQAVKTSVPKREPKKKDEKPQKKPKPSPPTMPIEQVARDIELLIDALQRSGHSPSEGKEQALILLTLEEHMRITNGDRDVVLRRTDGTTMTGAEYVSREHAIDLNVALIHPVIGSLNMYRTERASAERGGKPGPVQRALAAAS